MTVGKAAALRRAGSLPALVAIEIAAVAGLHRLGGLGAFQIPWQQLGRDLDDWLLYSPVEDVLGAVLRMVALLVAWWLLASTALYLAASVTRVPTLVRSVEWLALPAVRRVADRAVAVALATSIAGASPAVAGTLVARRGPGLVAATTTTAPPAGGYVPNPAGPTGGQPPAPPSSSSTTTSTTSTTTSRPSTTASTLVPTTSTGRPPTTPTVEPPGPKPTFQATTSTPTPTTRAGVPATTRAGAPTTSAPGPGYRPRPAGTTTTTRPPGGSPPPAPPAPGSQGPGGTLLPTLHRVVRGDNLWLIAKNHLALATERNPRSLGNGEVAAYWMRVIAANRGYLRSKRPDLIYPGEYVRLPAIGRSAGS